MTKLLLAKPVTERIYQSLKLEIADLREQGIVPKLVIFMIGNNKKSQVYVDAKIKAGENLGIIVEKRVFSLDVSEKELRQEIILNNNDESVNGIIIQFPLPENLNKQALLDLVDPKKDVDGLTSFNKKNLSTREAHFTPATALGVIDLIKFYKLPIANTEYAMFGQGDLVGKPLADLLERLGASVIRINSQTLDVQGKIKDAAVIISAVGKPNFLTGDFLGKRLAIIDVGVSEVSSKIVGDVDDTAKQLADFATPTIGGIGPMTVAGLMKNVVSAAKLRIMKQEL